MENRQRPDKVVRLSVHRNTLKQRERHEVKRRLKYAVAHAARSGDVAGFALVVWGSGNHCWVDWFAGGPVATSSQIPEAARGELARGLHREDAVEAIVGPPPDDSA